jgi:hypothetical protein
MADAPISNQQREFRCLHCDGLIRIPRDLPPTTGPCPHCSGIITSPARETAEAAPQSPLLKSTPLPESTPPPAAVPTPMPETPPLPSAASPLPISAPPVLEVPAVPTGPPPPADPSAPDAPTLVPPEKSGDDPPHAAEDKAPERPSPLPTNIPPTPRRSGVITFMLVLLAVALLLFGIAYLIIQQLAKNIPPPISDTPADGFSVYDVPEKDRQRGLFMMIYDLPPQFEFKQSFRPLATLEVQHGLDPAAPLFGRLARAADCASDPVRVLAFIKRTDKNLKLDWETSRDASDSEPVTSAATVELKWEDKPDAPELAICRFLCWEFLGLGGEQSPRTVAS